MNQVQESVLFRVSAASDIQSSAGTVTVAGLSATKRSRIAAITQLKYRAEVSQVITIGATTYVPTSNTRYTVLIGDTNRMRNGASENLKPYSTVTATVTGVAATDREVISAALVTAINADSSNFVAAATLGGGAGFTVTDDAGYYPAFSQTGTGRLGASQVIPASNADDTGYAATNVTTTTAAVYGVGVGATLLSSVPAVDALYGGLLSGYLKGLLNGISYQTTAATPLSPVSGQNYDIFIINSLTEAAAHNQRGQLALVPKMQAIAVDNGTGSSVTNLAGFKAFERVMHKIMVDTYASDAGTVQEFFDRPIVFQDPLGAAPTGTADTLGWMLSPYGSLNRTNIGTQTIVVPVLDATGLLIDQDDTATEGAHYSANQQALGDQSFIVGKTSAMVAARVVMGDYTDAAFILGFRKKEAYNAVFNSYTDYATIGNGSSAAGTTYINGDLFVTRAELNGGGILQTVSAVAPVDAVSYTCWVKVDINGSVTAFVNGTSYPIYSAGTTQMVFDSGDEIIPCFQITNIGGGDPACSIGEFFAVATDNLIV